MKKRIVILGSTGSIGMQALEVITANSNLFEVVGLAVMSNIKGLEEQIHKFNPKAVAVYNKEKGIELSSKIYNYTNTKVLLGMEGLSELSQLEEADIIINSVVGSVGLIPTLKAIHAKKTIALANKETLVVAGSVIMKAAEENNVSIIPIDSEHSAIFQCLNGENKKYISKLILTASGGPFRNYDKKDLVKVKAKDALKHPNWDMGKKITIDSSTLMNKGLEVIEAKWLFNVDVDNIEVVVHPQSIVHSMVEFKDYSIIAQLGVPDMKIPIQYALTYPKRIEGDLPRLDFNKIETLNFYPPDFNKFPCLQLAYEGLRIGGTMPCIINGANEVLVELFLQDRIGYYDIPKYIEKAMMNHKPLDYTSIEEVLEADKWVREWIKSII